MKQLLLGLMLLITITGCSSSPHDRCVDNYLTVAGVSWWEKYTDSQSYRETEFAAIRACMRAAAGN